ncbi:hypothetical protein PGT21_024761 [Puccinia graminis f. sp. tritici]|uniref:Uncharacterized protein n=1 Tax=Puccinia graminis f. sp. tritici TaxID=56615 RepID=A0A5B0LWP5_PUCGR|nr:hypothetical protein PGTUg99_022877 [Puccinia graminis f. sp. tritici]KAA1104482.1 hypothetical protein PGT21_024761 [Puccinia graminis f. sp. tritici]
MSVSSWIDAGGMFLGNPSEGASNPRTTTIHQLDQSSSQLSHTPRAVNAEIASKSHLNDSCYYASAAFLPILLGIVPHFCFDIMSDDQRLEKGSGRGVRWRVSTKSAPTHSEYEINRDTPSAAKRISSRTVEP